jgi:toxin CptA
MPNSRTWSNISAPCRVERRASRWQAAAFALLGLLAAVSALASAMPAVPAVLLATAAVLYGAWLGWRELRAAPVGLSIRQGGMAAMDSEPVNELRIHWRGPAAFVQWRDRQGRRQRWVATPDVLDPPARRALRLAGATARSLPSVAP